MILAKNEKTPAAVVDRRRSSTGVRQGGTVYQCLARLGIPRSELYQSPNAKRRRNGHIFRALPESDLMTLLSRARDGWRMRIKAAHPDRGGTLARAAEVNTAWVRVRRTFERHGYTLE